MFQFNTKIQKIIDDRTNKTFNDLKLLMNKKKKFVETLSRSNLKPSKSENHQKFNSINFK